MSQPDYPETVYCPSGHAYEMDDLSDEQRDQAEVCPYCNPIEETMRLVCRPIFWLLLLPVSLLLWWGSIRLI